MTVIFVLVACTSAGKLTNANDHKDISSASPNNVPSAMASGNQEHVIAKRAWNSMNQAWGKRSWNQLHSGWGKRSSDEPTDDELEDLQRQALLRLYADQLSRIENSEYVPEVDDDGAVEKRAWNQQLKRGPDNWNNMRGLWGKRAEKWGKLSSAWGRK